jgi:polysaccharide deacetylase family protein (PEP-CTERM system associated)
VKNALSFDIEDYYQVSAFSKHVDKSQWDKLPSRVVANTSKLLDLLSETEQTGTFFVLGWVAQQYPKLILEIAQRGHEIACHSLEHRRVYEMSRDHFFEDTREAKMALEDAGGQAVRGYRAPSFSITQDCLWAFEVLAELGFTYDSSIFPVRHPNYGVPTAPRGPFRVETKQGSIVEFPLMTIELGRRRSPLGGGAYFRILPYWYTRWGIRHVNKAEGRPACVYLHPWELDSEQPRIAASITARVRHYLGLRRAELKLRRLLHDFQFHSLSATIAESTIEPFLAWCAPFRGAVGPVQNESSA